MDGRHKLHAARRFAQRAMHAARLCAEFKALTPAKIHAPTIRLRKAPSDISVIAAPHLGCARRKASFGNLRAGFARGGCVERVCSDVLPSVGW